ncbi:hypothetical protein [Actinoplanes sp. TBRC 11911]|uniref:hypothetical protein n=1 Tax=Actinoplanes sp. TBRC 11911 TaxID=2729386 RepID=UPI00200709CD|nr:hypothetical protein [Actinoplanes sp. TBRC 11911]
MTPQWRRLAVRCAVVPSAVLLPLATLAPAADQQYDVYWHGSTVRSMPWTLVTENLRTIPMYLDAGSFGPLGRMAEWSADVAVYVLVEILRLPAELGLALLSAVSAAVLTGAVVVFAEALTARDRMFAGPPAAAFTVLPFAMAGCLAATVLFGAFTFLSVALVLGVAAWMCRGPRRVVPVVAAGLALAAFNEIAAFAVPLATVAVLVRGRRALLRPVALLWAGFLPLFVPMWLLSHHRVESVPAAAAPVLARPGLVVIALAVLVFGALAVPALKEVGALARLDRRQAVALSAAGAALSVLGVWGGAAMAAAGGVLLLGGLAALRGPVLQRCAIAALAAVAAGAAVLNQAYSGAVNHAPPALVANAIAGEVAQFDASDAGDARRCALRDRFAALTAGVAYGRVAAAELPGTSSPAERLDLVLDMATVQMYGQPFCGRNL